MPKKTAVAAKPTRAQTLKTIGDALSAALAACQQAEADGVKVRELGTVSILLTSAITVIRLLQMRAGSALRGLRV